MAIALGLLVALAYGSADFIGGLASRRLPTAVVLASTQSTGLVLVTIAAIVLDGEVHASDLLRGAGAGIAGIVGLALLYRGLARGLMSVVAPITAIGAGAAPLIWGLATGERPSTLAWIGLFAALVAVALISRPGGAGPADLPPKELGLAMVAGAAFGAVFILLGETSSSAGVLPVVASRSFTVPIAIAWALTTAPRPLRTVRPRGRQIPFLALGGTLDASANIVFIAAARHGLLSEVSVVSALYPGATVVLAWLVLGERVSRMQRAGLALALGGVALIAT